MLVHSIKVCEHCMHKHLTVSIGRHRVSPPTESLTSKPSAQNCTCQLLSLHQHLHQTDKQCRHLPLRRAILACLKMAIGSGKVMLILAANIYQLVTYGTHIAI